VSETDIDDAEAHRLRGWYLDEWVTTEMMLDAVISVAFSPGAPNMHQILKTLLAAARFDGKLSVLDQLVAVAPGCPERSVDLARRLRAGNEFRNRLAHDVLMPAFGSLPPHLVRWRKGASQSRPFTRDNIEEAVAELRALRNDLRDVMRPVAEHTHRVQVVEE
jgi:hypothetical protein